MGKMSREDLFREIGEIDEKYVEEARRAGRKRRAHPWAGRMLVAAASLMFCMGVGYMTVLLTQRRGSASDSMSGGQGTSAMNTAQQQYSMAENTGSQTAGGTEGGAEAVPEEAPMASGAAPENAYGKTDGQQCDEPAGSAHTESGIGQTGADQTWEAREEAFPITDKESAMDDGQQSGDSTMPLTWEAARADEVYGRYVDVQAPEGYSFTSADRSTSLLRVTWNKDMEEISITCRQADESVSDWLVDVGKPEEYDLGLYTAPWEDSVPQELYTQVSNATFRPEQITSQIVAARTWQVQEAGGVSGSRTRIGILYSDNVLVESGGKGTSPEEIYAMIYWEDNTNGR